MSSYFKHIYFKKSCTWYTHINTVIQYYKGIRKQGLRFPLMCSCVAQSIWNEIREFQTNLLCLADDILVLNLWVWIRNSIFTELKYSTLIIVLYNSYNANHSHLYFIHSDFNIINLYFKKYNLNRFILEFSSKADDNVFTLFYLCHRKKQLHVSHHHIKNFHLRHCQYI